MLSGCCVVSTPFHDWDKYIINGKNGFIISGKNVDEAVELLKWLRRNPSKAEKIGQEGRKTALYYFSMDRYREDWMKLIKEALNSRLVGKEMIELKKQLTDLYFLIPGAKKNSHWESMLENTLINFSNRTKKL